MDALDETARRSFIDRVHACVHVRYRLYISAIESIQALAMLNAYSSDLAEQCRR